MFFGVLMGRFKLFDGGSEWLWVAVRFFWVIMNHCGRFDGISIRLLVAVRSLWVAMSYCEWFSGGSSLLWVVLKFFFVFVGQCVAFILTVTNTLILYTLLIIVLGIVIAREILITDFCRKENLA